MNKKGFLLGTFSVKIIIAILCIIVLIGGIFYIYGIYDGKRKLAQAGESLDEIKSFVDEMQDGETKVYILRMPYEWYLYSDSNKLYCSEYGKGVIKSMKTYKEFDRDLEVSSPSGVNNLGGLVSTITLGYFDSYKKYSESSVIRVYKDLNTDEFPLEIKITKEKNKIKFRVDEITHVGITLA